MKEDEQPMTPPTFNPRGKRNQRNNHAAKSECLPLDQAAKMNESVECSSQEYISQDGLSNGSQQLQNNDNETEATYLNSICNLSNIRSRNFSSVEKKIFRNIVLKFMNVLANNKYDQRSLEEKSETWDAITIEYNNFIINSGFETRNVDQLHALYKRLKSGNYFESSGTDAIEDVTEVIKIENKYETQVPNINVFRAGKRVRSRNFTEQEKEIFIQIMAEYVNQADSSLGKPKSIGWEQITKEYSKRTGTNDRNAEHLYQLYNNLKKRARREACNIEKQEPTQNAISPRVVPQYSYNDSNSADYYEPEDTENPPLQNPSNDFKPSTIIVKPELQRYDSSNDVTNPNEPERFSDETEEHIYEKPECPQDQNKQKYLEEEHQMKMKILQLEYETKEKICEIDLLIKEKERILTENNVKASILNLQMKKKELAIKELELKKLMSE